jgi:hypothetical protein
MVMALIRKWRPTARPVVLAVAVITAVLAVSILTPAIGAPGLNVIFKKANKALKLGKQNKKAVGGLQQSVGGLQQSVTGLDQSTLKDLVLVESRTYSVAPGETTVDAAGLAGFTADCPSGYLVVGTGWEGDFGDMWSVNTYEFFVGGFGTNDASIPGDFRLQAICAQTSQPFYKARAGTDFRSRGDALSEYENDNRGDQEVWTSSSK